MSSLVADANRETFANKIVALVDKYNLDGVNLDWGKFFFFLDD